MIIPITVTLASALIGHYFTAKYFKIKLAEQDAAHRQKELSLIFKYNDECILHNCTRYDLSVLHEELEHRKQDIEEYQREIDGLTELVDSLTTEEGK